jgi:integrase
MATLRIIGGNYVLDWRDAQGKRIREPLGRVGVFPKRDAERILRDKRRALSPGHRILNPDPAPTLSSFATDYLAWHAAEYPASHGRIRQIIETHLLPEFGDSELDSLNPRQVDQWKHKRLAPRDDRPKSETVAKELRTLKAVLAKAVEWRVIPAHPIESVAAPLSLDSKPPRFYTADELTLIYAACRKVVNNGEGPQPNPQHAAWWRLFANTGMRRGEGIILKRQWIGREAMKILSTEEERTKSRKWREIPLTEGALMALDEIPKIGEYVLPRITPEGLSHAASKDIRRAGLDGSAHTFRHTYISHMVMAGVPLRTVQKLAGHSTMAVTEKYAHLAPGHLMNAGRAISL